MRGGLEDMVRAIVRELVAERKPPLTRGNPVVERACLAVSLAHAAIEPLCGLELDSGYVYAIRTFPRGPVKIGRAGNPSQRIATIQAFSPLPVTVIGLAHGDAVLEASLHSKYRRNHVHGEWFDIDENPLPVIDGKCFGCDGGWRR